MSHTPPAISLSPVRHEAGSASPVSEHPEAPEYPLGQELTPEMEADWQRKKEVGEGMWVDSEELTAAESKS